MARGKRILVVDDAPDNLRLLGVVLEDAGYEVVVATTGGSGLERSRLHPRPDLILLDIVLPDLGGHDVLGRLKSDPSTCRIPVILISGLDEAEKKIEGFRLGAVDYITKPFQVDEVVARVGTHIELARAELLRNEIAEREKSEAALRKSEAELRRAQQVAHIGSWTWDIAGNRLDWSEEMFAIFGVDPGTFSGDLAGIVADRIHAEDRDKVARSNMSVLEANKPYPVQYRIVRPNGEIRTVWGEAGELQVDGTGRPVRLTGIVQDITDRMRMDEALRASEGRYRNLLMTAMDGFWLIDLDGRLLDANRTYSEFSGYAVEELVGMRVHELDALETESDVGSRLGELVSKGANRFQTIHRRKDGTTFDVEVSAKVWPGEGGRVVVFIRDITAQKTAEAEREKLEQRLRQSQRFDSIGRLASGVAHDFNNMLGVIQGHVELATIALAEDLDVRDDLAAIGSASKRLSELTRQLLAYARKEVVAPRLMDLDEAVPAILKLLERLINEDVRIGWSSVPDLWPIRMDPSQFDQVLTNLCINARDAIAGQGRIDIRLANRTVSESECAVDADLQAGDFVQITVADDGCGMDSETAARIFEPFFTTKPQGKGTGLGLATVYGVVKQNNGSIEVHSEPGIGTAFHLLFPRAEGVLDAEAMGKSGDDTLNGTETILLVEDEQTVLEMTKMALELRGYTILATTAPSEAIGMMAEHGDSIELLLTDVVMPEMNGKELRDALAKIHPGIECLFVSGYPSDIIAKHGILEEGVDFLRKPFSIEELGVRVREILDRKA